MKKVLFICSLFLISIGLAAQDNNSFWNLKYGSSRKQIETQILKERGLSPYNKGSENSKSLYYTDCTFSGEKVKFIGIDFVDDKFYEAVILLEPTSETVIFTMFNRLKNNLSEKYGDPTISRSKFKTPYEKGDGYEIQAIKAGKASFVAKWDSPVLDPVNEIAIMINRDVQVALIYTNIKLKEIIKDREKQEAIDEL